MLINHKIKINLLWDLSEPTLICDAGEMDLLFQIWSLSSWRTDLVM